MEVVITLIMDNMVCLLLLATSATTAPAFGEWTLLIGSAAACTIRGACVRPFPSNLAPHFPQEMAVILRRL